MPLINMFFFYSSYFYSQMSNKSNAVLLDVQKKRNDLLETLLEKAKVEVSNRMNDQTWHKNLLINLVAQGLKELLEENVVVIVCYHSLQAVLLFSRFSAVSQIFHY